MLTPLSLIEADQELLRQVILEESRDSSDPGKAEPKSASLPKPVLLPESGKGILFAGSLLLSFVVLVILLFSGLFFAAFMLSLSIAGILLSRKESKSVAADLSVQSELSKQKELLIFEACPQLLSQLNADLEIVSLNDACVELLGASSPEFIGKSVLDLILPDSKSRFLESAKRSKEKRLAESIEIRLKTKIAPESIDLLWRIEWSERASSYFCIADDISAQKTKERLEQELNELISHDLRAPVSALSLWISNMLLGTYGELSDHGKSVLKRSSSNLNSVLSLLDNLLDGNKLEAGRMRTKPLEFPLQEIFEQSERLYMDWFECAELKLEIERTDLYVYADREQCSRIISNLLSNAVKWSPPGTGVRVRARSEGNFACIEIEDSGPGIPEDLQSSLFQRWEAGQRSERAASPSIGLGLYIARLFTQLQGGQIGVSKTDSSGSTFWFSLPQASSGIPRMPA